MGLFAALLGGLNLLLAKLVWNPEATESERDTLARATRRRGDADVSHARRADSIRRIPHHHRLGA